MAEDRAAGTRLTDGLVRIGVRIPCFTGYVASPRALPTCAQQPGLRRLAAPLVSGETFFAAAAVSAASDLVADAVGGEATLALACEPSIPSDTDAARIEELFRALLHELDLPTPAQSAADWEKARWIAAAIMDGVLTPVEGCESIHRIYIRSGPNIEKYELLEPANTIKLVGEVATSEIGAMLYLRYDYEGSDDDADILDCAADILRALDPGSNYL